MSVRPIILICLGALAVWIAAPSESFAQTKNSACESDHIRQNDADRNRESCMRLPKAVNMRTRIQLDKQNRRHNQLLQRQISRSKNTSQSNDRAETQNRNRQREIGRSGYRNNRDLN